MRRRRPADRVKSLMLSYIARRILLMIPTLFGIMLVSFVIVQFAPGGPVERILAQLQGQDVGATSRIRRRRRFSGGQPQARRAVRRRLLLALSRRAGPRPEFIKQLEAQFGFDKPAHERFFKMLWNYLALRFRQELLPRRVGARADQGEAAGLDHARPLDDASLLRHLDPARHPQGGAGTAPASTSGPPAVIIVGYAIPGFLFAILLIVLFAGGSFWQIFPLARPHLGELGAALARSARSSTTSGTSPLPIIAMALGAFATSTLLTKNSFLDEIRKQYVRDRAHEGPDRAACSTATSSATPCCIVIAGFPGAFIGAFFAGSLLIETIFSLDGLGLLSFESIINRDYPVVFANALHLLARRPRRGPHLGPHLHLDRPPHRLRDAGGLR